MKIAERKDRPKRFIDLKRGDVFESGYAAREYMKTETVSGGSRNAVRLETGEATWFGPNAQIRPLPSAYLVIE